MAVPPYNHGVMRHPWSRLVAVLVDWLCILGWVAITVAVGVPLYLSGVTAHLSAIASNLIAALVTVVPVTVVLARLESGPRQASIGKRARHLRVVEAVTGSRVSFRRSILRNTLKIGLPWTIGHAAVYAIVRTSGSGPVGASVWVLTAVAYLVPLTYVGSLFVGTGRPPYDLIAGTDVICGTGPSGTSGPVGRHPRRPGRQEDMRRETGR